MEACARGTSCRYADAYTQRHKSTPHFYLPSFILGTPVHVPHRHLVPRLSDCIRPPPPWPLPRGLFTSTPPLVRDNPQRLTYQRLPATPTHSLVRRRPSSSPRTPSIGFHPMLSVLPVDVHARLAPRSQSINLNSVHLRCRSLQVLLPPFPLTQHSNRTFLNARFSVLIQFTPALLHQRTLYLMLLTAVRYITSITPSRTHLVHGREYAPSLNASISRYAYPGKGSLLSALSLRHTSSLTTSLLASPRCTQRKARKLLYLITAHISRYIPLPMLYVPVTYQPPQAAEHPHLHDSQPTACATTASFP